MSPSPPSTQMTEDWHPLHIPSGRSLPIRLLVFWFWFAEYSGERCGVAGVVNSVRVHVLTFLSRDFISKDQAAG